MTFESHVTVEGMGVEEFKSLCREVGTKPILVEMDSGSGVKQLMTSKFHATDSLEVALAELHQIAGRFPNVVRRKLERILGKGETPPLHLYLEFHSKFVVPVAQLGEFCEAVRAVGGHTSRNSFKVDGGDGLVYHFATARDRETLEKIHAAVEFPLVNTIFECVVYDDNPSVDSGWVCVECPFKTKVQS